MRAIRILISLSIALAILLTACAPKQAATGRKVATLIFTQEPDTLSPLYTNMYFSQILHQIYNAWAWDYDENNQPRPVLVTELPTVENGGLSRDGKTITLRLRDDIVWSDGKPITSADFKFTYQMYLEPRNTVASTYPYDQIVSLETPDARTVVMKFDQPFAPWLFFWHGLLPEHVLAPAFAAQGTLDTAAWNTAPTVGAGPFVFAEWETGSYLRFVANENYWLGRPQLDEIFVRIVPDDASQVAALKAGDGDIGIYISYPDVPTLRDAGLQVITVPSGYNEAWWFNFGENGHPALKDVRVRQALAYGTDRFTICRDLLLGLTRPNATFWENTPYADPTLQPYPYNPTLAAQLLDQAGWVDTNGNGTRDKDGVELVLRYGTMTKAVRQDTQAVIQQQLAQIGVGVTLLNYESDVLFATYGEGGPASTGKLDIMEWSDTPGAFPDPDTAYWRCSEIPSDETPQGVNTSFLCDEQLEALFDRQATQVDLDARIQTFHEISRLMYEQVYYLGIWYDPDIWAISPRLQNVKISGATPFFNVMEWTIAP